MTRIPTAAASTKDMKSKAAATTKKAMWDFGPSAYMNGYLESVQTLLEMYQKDNHRAQYEGVHVPPRSSSHGQRVPSALRTCQWNVHFFFNDNGNSRYKDGPELATAVVETLLEVDADVLVLNEFGMAAGHQDEAGRQCAINLLEKHGYTIQVADGCYCPTAIAIKKSVLPIEGYHKFQLDLMRAAVGVQVKINPNNHNNSVISIDESTGSIRYTTTNQDKDSHKVWIYGTHLEDSDDGGGHYRQEEIKCLLETIGVETPNVMIIGDFNQQRRQDYTHEEWELLAENKERRQSPLDDGVAYLLRAFGYSSIWDVDYHKNTTSKPPRTNWNPEHPPPSTHWTGTIVDYTYIKDERLELAGVYVSPSDLSDHRLIVCDWDLKQPKNAHGGGGGGAVGMNAEANRAGPVRAVWNVAKNILLPWRRGHADFQ